eukprot:g10066.t1
MVLGNFKRGNLVCMVAAEVVWSTGYLSRDVRLSVPLLVVNPKFDMRKVGFDTIKRMQKFGMQNALLLDLSAMMEVPSLRVFCLESTQTLDEDPEGMFQDPLVQQYNSRVRRSCYVLDDIPKWADLGPYWYEGVLPRGVRFFFRKRFHAVNEFEVSITRPGAGLSTGSGTVGGARVIPMDEAEAAKEIPGHGKVREIERRLASRLLEEMQGENPVGAAPVDVDPDDNGKLVVTEDTPLKCMFRIANESFTTDSFVPGQRDWQGAGCIRFMLASNVHLLVRVLVADSPGRTFGFARLRLGRVGEGEFKVTGEIRETEYVSVQDQLLGYITIKFTVTPNFTLNLAKLDDQYDTKNIPSLISVVSADSKTLGHRVGAFQGALQVLQSIVLEMQEQGGIGATAGKQLSVILDQLVIPEYCKDPVHPDHPTAGWLRRKKRDKRALSSSFVSRFFRLEYDAFIMRYTLSYGKEPSDAGSQMTKVSLDDGTRVLLPAVPSVPTPFALQIEVQKVSDFSFSEHDALRVVAQLGSIRQCTRTFCPKESTIIQSNVLLPIEQECLAYGNPSVATGNVGWFGEDVALPERQEGGDRKFEFLRFFIGDGEGTNAATAVGTCCVPFDELHFGRRQDMNLSLKGSGVADGQQLTVGITMRRLGQYKTAWPATMTALLQAGSTPSTDQNLWEGPCMVRTAPQGLEVFRPMANPEEPNKAVTTIDYYSVEAMTDLNASTLDISVIIEDESYAPSSKAIAGSPSPKSPGASPESPSTLPLQRMSVYFAKLLESKAHPLWGFDDPIDPRGFAREDLDRLFSSQYVQSGTFGAEAQGIENSVKGIGWALKSLNRRLDETKLFYHNSPEEISNTSRIFFQEYFLRCTGELGAHVISDDILREVPIEVVVAFVCFLVKRDNAFHDLLVDNSLEPDTNAFLTSILSIDSMIRRLTKRTELEIVAQWPSEGDITDDATPAFLTSLLEDCSPDPDNGGKLTRGNLGAKIFEGMFAAMPSFATTAAAAVFSLDHASCKDITSRYLAAFLNDMTRSAGLVQEMIDGSEEQLRGIPINVSSVQGGMFSAGVEVACLLADVAFLEMDAVCAEFFQAEWYADDENVVMRKACKLLNVGVTRLEKEIVKEPFFDHVIGAAAEKIAFRYLAGLMHRCTDGSSGKMISGEELERMHADVEMMQSYVCKYGKVGLKSVLHLKEAIVFLTEKPEILQQAVFVDILKRHTGKEEHVMKVLKTLTAVREDLRNFYIPAWLNKLTQKQTAVVQERHMTEMEGDGRASRIGFDVIEWVFQCDLAQPKGAYVYKYLMHCLRASRVG